MKQVQFSEDILPVGQLKAQLAQVLRKIGESGRPVVITQNGKPAAVMLSPREFDRLLEKELFVEAVREGLADSEAGRVIPDKELARLLAREFGPGKKK